jgi:pilus assembly protein Flp/PilA
MLFRPRQEEGQGLVEYALILVLVAVVVIVILALLGPTIGNIFSNIATGLKANGAG